MRLAILSSSFILVLTSVFATLAQDITPYPQGQYHPTLAVCKEGNPHVVWEEILPDQQNDIYYAKSYNGGKTFLPAKSVFEDPYDQSRACITVDSQGNPHVVWTNWKDYNIYFVKSQDGGETFPEPIRIDNADSYQDRPYIVTDSNDNPLVAWVEVNYVQWNPLGHIYVTRSLDQGLSFEESVCVNCAEPPTQGWPSMALDLFGNLLVVWHAYHDDNFDIYFAKSEDGGQTFSKTVVVNEHPVHQLVYGKTAIAVDRNSNPIIIFMAEIGDKRNLYLTRSIDGGQTFSRAQKLHEYGFQEGLPTIAVDSKNHLHIAWSAKRKNLNVVYWKLDLNNDGEPLFPIRRVDPMNCKQHRVTLAIDPYDDPHLAWRDGRGLIYYTRSVDGGFSFLPSFPVFAE